MQDEQLSDCEHKVLYNPSTKKGVVSYRGPDVKDWAPTEHGRLQGDVNIFLDQEKTDRCFKQVHAQFKQATSTESRGTC